MKKLQVEGWKVEKLGDVCEVIGGGTPSKTNKKFYNGSIHWATVRDMKFDVIEDTEHKITEEAVKKSSTNIIPKNNVVIATRVGLGKVCILKHDTAINQDLRGIIPHDSSQLLPRFLFLWFKSVADLITKEGTGATVQGVKLPFIKSLEIPVPPLPEQQRIVTLLDETFAGLAQVHANAERNLVNAREIYNLERETIFENVIQKWGTKSLGDLCTSVEYGSSAKSQKTGKVTVLRMGNIQNGRFDWNKLVFTSNKEEIEKYSLKFNDVLFNRTNSLELVGKTAIYKGEQPAIFAGYLIRINRKEELIDADYLNIFLNSDMAKQYGRTVVISSVNQANINGQKLKGYPIPLPPLEEQRTIVERLDALAAETSRLEAVYQSKLEAVGELRKSVLGKAFEGELSIDN